MTKSLSSAITRFSGRLSLRTVLIVPLVLQILGIAGLVGYLSFKNGQRAVNELAARLSQETGDHVQSYIKNYLETPHLINEANAEAIQLGVLDVFNVKDTELLERYFTRQLQVFELVSYISVSNEKGGIIGAGRHNDGRLEVASTKNFTKGTFALYAADSRGHRKRLLGETQNYDTRTRPWYITLAQAGRPAWSEINTYTDNNVGITAGLPFYNAAGKLAGILTTDLALSQISVFLQRLPVSKPETIFVMERSGLLVASSAPEELYVLNQNQQADRRKAIESKTPLVRDTARYLMNRFSNFNNINGNQQIDFKIEGQRHFLQLNSLKDGRGIDWLIVVVVPESSFVKQIHANTRTTILLCIIALIVSILICILIVRWITQPILILNQSAKALAKGRWQHPVNIERSDELGELAKSFNSMTHELQASFDEMKALNEALSQSEKRFQLIAQVTNDVIWDWDFLTNHTSWNARIRAVFGYTVDEIDPHIDWWHERIHPDDRERVISGLDINNSELFWSAEYRFRRADGSYAYVADRGLIIRDDSKPIRMIGGMTDVTQRKQTEKLLENYNRTLEQQVAERTTALQQSEAELRHREQELRLIADALPALISYVDANRRYQFINRTYENWFNRHRDEILGSSVHQLLGETVYLMVEPYVNQVFQGQTVTLEAELPYEHGKRWINATFIPDFDSQAQVRGFYGLITDISDRKRAEQASILEERNRMAREIHDTLAQAFTGILLHNGAAIERIANKPETAQIHLQTIDELARIGLTEARRSVEALRPKLLEEGDLPNALKHLTAQMRSSTDAHITCETIGSAYALSPHVENHLLRIGQEALTNAIKYAHATQIQIELVYEEMQCLLRVKDNGQGFSLDQISSAAGFGLLGMSERAEQISAELVIHSQPGRGTEVVVVVDRK